MQFFRRAEIQPRRLGVLPGTFNPVTVAHLALAKAALSTVDEVVFVLPRVFPHKHYSGATFRQRLHMLDAAVGGQPRYSVAASRRGLFAEIARRMPAGIRPGRAADIFVRPGRRRAYRLGGTTARPARSPKCCKRFDLLVAARTGEYMPPAEFADFISALPLEGAFDHVSATEVRQRIARREPWEHLVPEPTRRVDPANTTRPLACRIHHRHRSNVADVNVLRDGQLRRGIRRQRWYSGGEPP